ncbi:NAD(P)-dependent oxidoreductase [archaeon]|nr:NAD(P)-dependent oxidoreductase [archaeon]
MVYMKVLVTGGTGFIGRYLVNRLLKLGHEVVVLADDTKGEPPEGSTYIKGDIRDGYNVKKAFEGCECVFHLAAITDVRDSNDEVVYATNFLGAKNVFEVAKSKNAKIIFTSTAAVYGNGNVPNKEMDECKPISQYGKSKLRAEWYLQNIGQESFIVRLFNVYGFGGHSFINVLCEKMPKYEDILIFGNGLQTRDYVYVDDVVDALLLGFEKSGLYNVGTGMECSTTRVVSQFLGTYLRFLANFTYLAFLLSRLWLIGKEHGKLVIYMAKNKSIKVYISYLLAFRLSFFNASKLKARNPLSVSFRSVEEKIFVIELRKKFPNFFVNGYLERSLFPRTKS